MYVISQISTIHREVTFCMLDISFFILLFIFFWVKYLSHIKPLSLRHPFSILHPPTSAWPFRIYAPWSPSNIIIGIPLPFSLLIYSFHGFMNIQINIMNIQMNINKQIFICLLNSDLVMHIHQHCLEKGRNTIIILKFWVVGILNWHYLASISTTF